MMENFHFIKVDGRLPDWRAGIINEDTGNDEDLPVEDEVLAVLGFDPDNENWDDTVTAALDYPLKSKDQWPKNYDYAENGGRMVEMTPEEFLSKAAPLEVTKKDLETVGFIKQHVEGGGTLNPLVIYSLDKKVSSSDGRHRSLACIDLGIEQVPVIDYTGTGVTKIVDGWEEVERAPAGTSEGGQWTSGNTNTYTDEDDFRDALYQYKKTVGSGTLEKLLQYTGTFYQGLNNELRADDPVLSANNHSMKIAIDQYIKDAPKFQAVSYRGIDFSNKESWESFKSKAAVGQVLSDPAFLSTSLSERQAKHFNNFSYSALIKINGKSGTFLNGLATTPDELEVLFARNTKFRVTKIQETSHNFSGQLLLELEEYGK